MRSRKPSLPLATRARELCPYRYVSKMFRTDNFLSQNVFIVFLETTFLRVSCYPVHSKPNISVFQSLHLPLYTQFWTRGFPLVMRSRKAGLALATRAWKRELCTYRYVLRMTRTEKMETTVLHISCYTVHCEPKIFFGFSESTPS